MSSGRETILPVVTMLLFGDGGERSDEVLKKRSSPSLDLFIWQGSDGLGGIMFMVFGLAWVVPDLAHLSFFHWLDGRLLDFWACLCATSIGGLDFWSRRFSFFALSTFRKTRGMTQGISNDKAYMSCTYVGIRANGGCSGGGGGPAKK